MEIPRRSFAKAPKGKLPFIEDEDGTVVGDFSLIIGRLSRQRGIDMDAPLDDRQRCVSLAFRRMLDEHLYRVAVYSRWFDDPGWSVIRQSFFAGVRRPIRPFAVAAARRWMAVQTDGHMPGGGLIPSLIGWQTAAHPSSALPDKGYALERLEGWHTSPNEVVSLLTPLGVAHLIAIRQSASSSAPVLVAHIRAPNGTSISLSH